ncbi:unnamed protein product [Ixodes persulcatus]
MVNPVDIIKEILMLSIFCAGRHSKFNVGILQQTDDNGDRIVLWCRPGGREEDGYCVVCILYFVLCKTPENKNVIYVPFPFDWATVFTSYYERSVYISETFIYILFTCHASFYRGHPVQVLVFSGTC